jgi:sugar-specific transcriptional regulator TrmB
MRLLTKIIGKPPGEMEPDELHTFVLQNRARIRREIKEYRRLKAAIKAEQPKARRKSSPVKQERFAAKAMEKEMIAMAKELGITLSELIAQMKEFKEKTNADS